MASALEELRRLRREGKTRTLEFDEESARIYDECTDREYEAVQRQRLRTEQFVVDDDGEGYVDNGEYEWAGTQSPAPKRAAVAEPEHGVAAMFRSAKPRAKTVARPAAALPATPAVDIEAIYSGLSKPRARATGLGGLRLGARAQAAPGLKPLRAAAPARPIRLARDSSTDEDECREAIAETTIDTAGGAPLEAAQTSEPTGPYGRATARTTTKAQPKEASQLASATASAAADTMLVDTDQTAEGPVAAAVVGEAVLSTSPLVDTNSGLPVATAAASTGALGSGAALPPSSPSPSESDVDDAIPQLELARTELPTPVNSDDNEPFLRFFWTDFHEQNGLTLFGRSESGKSVAVLVRDLNRDLYFAARPGCTLDDVVGELDAFYARQKLTAWRSKLVLLRDVFAEDKQAREYLHVLHPFDTPLPAPAGKTYLPYRGGSTRRIESFLLSRQIMGPCWLDVGAHSAANMLAYVQIAAQASARSVSRTADSDARALGTPTLRALGVAVQTQLEDGQHAVAAIAVTVYADALASARTASLAVRPPPAGFAPGFKARARADHVELLANERALLAWFFALVEIVDPDFLVGHSLTDVHVASLLERALQLGVPAWQKLGRARQIAKPASASPLEVLRVTAGRLLVDLKNPFGIEVAGAQCQEYNLDEMAQKVLRRARKRVPVPEDAALAELAVLQQLKLDADCAFQIALAAQMLPLSLELTQLAGSPWRSTLRGSRSARNDFLLMHEFRREGVLIPERERGRAASAGQKRRAQYTGGLVFDPVKGLHTPCVLVMDFNSLYPSIIQEHNICFSTVAEDADGPPADAAEGILPRLLRSLVERRRQVKQLMKNSPKDAKQTEWDTRQRALKLTANSMYGCLGLKESRFAAQHLAQLVTLKGREALARARALAEQQGLQVLYGDTDSVMVQTHAGTYAEALAIGFAFKEVVNKQYRCMEIDIDAVFRALLLHTKKKYAAAQLLPSGDVKLEIKGLDMRRREFCDASKLLSADVLAIVLGTKPEYRELDPLAVFEHVLASVSTFAERMRAGELKPNMFVIRRQLSKEVDAFEADSKQPHIVVARQKIKAGEIVKAHDVIGYVYAKGAGPVSVELMKAQDLAIDFEYYLEHQVFTPIKRLCEQLDEFDEPRLADALGLAHQKKRAPRAIQGTTPFVLEHNGHRCELQTLKLAAGGGGIECPQCSETVPTAALVRQVRGELRALATRYYNRWLVCDECECLTRAVALSTRRCPQARCRGTLALAYPAEKLYAQWQAYERLFAPLPPARDAVHARLQRSAFGRVRLGALFAPV